MKKLIYPFIAVTILVISAFTTIRTLNWKISDSYSVKFNGGDISGEFRGLKGIVNFDPANLSKSQFNTTIEVASINTGNGMKNTHAKSDKWFDAEKYPVINFTSSAITKSASGYVATGILSMHGVQKQVLLPFTFDNNIFKGSFEVSRMDFKINDAEPDHGAQKFAVSIVVPVTQ